MRPSTCVAAVLVVTPVATVAAQDSPPIKPGDRVRVQVCTPVCEPRVTGSVLELRSDALVVNPERSADTLQVALALLGVVEVSRGQKSHALAGLGIGFLGGAAVGAVGGALVDCQSSVDLGEGFCVIALAGVSAGAGLVLGGMIGLGWKTERWKEVPLDQLRVSFTPQRDGRIALQASLRF